MEQGALTLSMSVSKLSSVRSWAGLTKDDTAHEKTIADERTEMKIDEVILMDKKLNVVSVSHRSWNKERNNIRKNLHYLKYRKQISHT